MNIKQHLATWLGLISLALLTSCSETTSSSHTGMTTNSGADYQNSRADVVILSFFDMYCPHCQRSADAVNQLYTNVQKAGQGNRIDFYAIGRNNTPMESATYQKRYQVPFTVLSDRNLSISSRFNKTTPPLLIALKKQGSQWKEFYRTRNIQGNVTTIQQNIQP